MNYDYDLLNEMTKVRENGATSGVGVLASYTYDDLGNRTGATFGNGTSASWTPDPLSRLASLVHNLGGTSDDLTRTFAYNPASQIASLTSSNDAYAWDGAANVNRSYTTNGLNQYTLSGGTALGYDTRGNLTTSGTDSYTYSSENLLKTGPGSTSLSYDPLLRLYQVTQGSSTTRFAYDGLEMAAEYNSSNVLQKRYVYGPGADEPIVQYTGTGTTTRAWLAADERGSVIAMTDSSGTPTAIDSYDEYGIPGTANSGRFQYTGQAWIAELGLYYYKARFYSPSLGRFLQTDPIGYGDGLNWYNYTGSDPVNFIDPMGLLAQGPDDDTACADTGDAYLCPPIIVNSPSVGGCDETCYENYWEFVSETLYDKLREYIHVPTFQIAPVFPTLGNTSEQQSIWSRLVKKGKQLICSGLSLLPDGASLSLGASAQGYGGIGGYAGASAFIDSKGNTGFNISYGGGAGFGLLAGAGLSVGTTPAAGHTRISHIQGGFGVGYGGASGSYSTSEGGSISGGISAGPDIGYAAGSVDGVSDTTAGRNICK